MSKAKPRLPTLSNSLTVKAGPTGMQKVLKQNLHKIVIYINKPRPEAKDYSQSTANKGCKILFNVFKFNNQHDMSTSAPTVLHAICINIRTEHQPIIWHKIYVLKRYKWVEKLSTLISGCCSCIRSVSLINNSRSLKADAEISRFLKSMKWSGYVYKCLTTSVVWWFDFLGLCSSRRNFKFLWVCPI